MKVSWEAVSIMSRIWTTTALASAALLVAVPAETGAQQSQLPSVTIGIITDGQSPRFQGFVATVMTEIQLLLERDAVASFPVDKQIAVEEGVGAAAAARSMLRDLGFSERTRGSHHIFWKAGIGEHIVLARSGSQVKPYQVRRIRTMIRAHGLHYVHFRLCPDPRAF